MPISDDYLQSPIEYIFICCNTDVLPGAIVQYTASRKSNCGRHKCALWDDVMGGGRIRSLQLREQTAGNYLTLFVHDA